MKFKALLALALVFGIVLSSAALAARHNHRYDSDDDDYHPITGFTLVNNTNYNIRSVYVSPVAKNDWQECSNSYGGIIYVDEAADIEFEAWVNAQYWDMRCVFTNGKEEIYYGMALNSASVVVIYNRGDFELEERRW